MGNFIFSRRIPKVVLTSSHPEPGPTAAEMTSSSRGSRRWAASTVGEFTGHGLRLRAEIRAAGRDLACPTSFHRASCRAPSPTPWDALASSVLPFEPAPRLGPARLQLCPPDSWGRARPRPDDLTWWKGKCSAFLLQSTSAKCQAVRRSRLGISRAHQCGRSPKGLRGGKLGHL